MIRNHRTGLAGAEWNCLYETSESERESGQIGERERGLRGVYENVSSGSSNVQSLVRREKVPLGEGGRDGSETWSNYNYGENGTVAHPFSEENLGIRTSDGLSGLQGNFHNESTSHGHTFCNRTWDGLLCWPQAPEGTSVSLPCFKHFRGIAYNETGNVTRFCQMGGIWQNKTDYSECIPKPHPTTETSTIGPHDVYFAGYCLSLAALLIAILIFIAFRELRCLRNTIHSNLILTYILADALWLMISIQSNMGHQTQVSCFTFILLHYFHLTNFFWMFVEGLYLYLLVVKTFTAKNVKLRIYNFIGWGLPLLVVISWSIAKWKTQTPTTGVSVHSEVQRYDAGDEIYGCFWLTVNIYDWIYKGPAILVLAANSIFLMKIMWVLITKLRSATNPETQQSRKAAKALVVLMPLLGITYVLVLRGSGQTPAYEITRASLISTQGFLVALLYCFLNGEVRIALRHRWNQIRDMLGTDLSCTCCLLFDRRNSSVTEWSPRSQTESIRLFTPTPKRGSSTSDSTTATTVLGPSSITSHTILVTSTPRKTSDTVVTSIRTYNSTDNNLL